MLSLFNLPCTGFCEMSELFTVPRILIGNRQLSPDTTSMSLVELSPQSASVADIEQSEAARAKDTGIKLVAPTISAKAATLDNRIVDFLVFMQKPTLTKLLLVRGVSWPPNWTSGWRMEQLSDAELMRIAMGSQQIDATSAPRSPKFRSNVVAGVRTVTLSQIVHFQCSAHEKPCVEPIANF
jgi:hypothetical protein